MMDSKFWGKFFRYYDVLNLLIPYQELLEEICKELDADNRHLVLEAGCGTGNLAIKIKKSGARVIGLDNCQEALDIYKIKDSTAVLVLADLTKTLPFQNDYFDRITSNNTIYSLSKEDQLFALAELYRALKPGGKFVMANISRGWNTFEIYFDGLKKNIAKEGILRTIYTIIRIIFPTVMIFYYNWLIHKNSNFYFFDYNEQKDLLEKIGFKNISETKKVYSGQGILNSAYK